MRCGIMRLVCLLLPVGYAVFHWFVAYFPPGTTAVLFARNVVCALTVDRESGRRRYNRHWFRHRGSYSSLDYPASSL